MGNQASGLPKNRPQEKLTPADEQAVVHGAVWHPELRDLPHRNATTMTAKY
ncbi:MAG: hypothetical protein R3F44_01420 [Candidatus Competibacteraceae bacterium]